MVWDAALGPVHSKGISVVPNSGSPVQEMADRIPCTGYFQLLDSQNIRQAVLLPV